MFSWENIFACMKLKWFTLILFLKSRKRIRYIYKSCMHIINYLAFTLGDARVCLPFVGLFCICNSSDGFFNRTSSLMSCRRASWSVIFDFRDPYRYVICWRTTSSGAAWHSKLIISIFLYSLSWTMFKRAEPSFLRIRSATYLIEERVSINLKRVNSYWSVLSHLLKLLIQTLGYSLKSTCRRCCSLTALKLDGETLNWSQIFSVPKMMLRVKIEEK